MTEPNPATATALLEKYENGDDSKGHSSLKDVQLHHEDKPADEELHRALKPRQITMIAIGGSIGTGLVVASGQALVQAGPVGLLIAYIVMGLCCYATLSALGEMSSQIPSKRGFPGHASSFVSEAFGFAVGWNYLMKYLIVIPAQLNASALIISYWDQKTSGAVYITVFAVVIIAGNFVGVRFFGEIEFWLSFAKIVVLTALIFLSIFINVGATPNHDYIGFENWTGGRAFAEYKASGALGRFLGTWSAMVLALYAFVGTELIGVTAGEAKDARRTIPKAIRSTFARIVIFYWGLIFLIGLNVPSDSPDLLGATKNKGNASASPFVVSIKLAGIKVLPGILNGLLLIFTFSAANSDLYVASRTLYGLAKSRQAPAIFLRCDKRGTPWVCISFCALFCSVAYINAASGGSTTFGYLTSAVTVNGSLSWLGILIAHQRFMAGLKAQGVDRSSLIYSFPLQPWYGLWAIFTVTLVVIFKGFAAFIGHFDYKSFLSNYFGLPVIIALFLGYKFIHGSRFVKAKDMDVHSAAELWDVEDEGDEEAVHLTPKEKVLKYLKEW